MTPLQAGFLVLLIMFIGFGFILFLDTINASTCYGVECVDPEPLPPRDDWGGDHYWIGHCVNTFLHGKITNENNTIHVWFNGCSV